MSGQMSAATIQHVIEEHAKDLVKHADDISQTKKAISQIEVTLVKLEMPVRTLVKLMFFIGFGVLASIGAAIWQVVIVHGKVIIP